MKIIGAGLSGLLAGALNPGSTIYERQGSLPNNHGAILRFRSNEISRALGIPFRKVVVSKAIFHDSSIYIGNPSPHLQNMYSYKVTGQYSNRSISNLDPVTRYIAPDNFIKQLAARCNIVYNLPWPDFTYTDSGMMDKPIISTIPMPVMLDALGLKQSNYQRVEFTRKRIWVQTFTVANCDLYQTIYFPGPETSLYRASFTGDKLICEFVADPQNSDEWPSFSFKQILDPFGLCYDISYTGHGTQDQKFGKIVEIDRNVRRSIMATLTHDFNIYSLGRFATWRNILLDDVYHDIFKIRDLMNLDSYSRRLALSEEK